MKFKNHIKIFFKENKYFLVPYLIFVSICAFFLISYSKKDIHIWLNGLSSPLGDKIFPYITFLGDGLFVLIICVLMLLYRSRYSILIFTTFALSGLIVQIMKKFIFYDILRPQAYFKDIYNLHFVEGIKLYKNGSFPSGHSASAFALFLCLSVVSKNNFLKFCCFLAACIIGYSRIYLSQHFLVDVVFGSLIGVLTVMIYSYFNSRLEAGWLDKPLLGKSQI
jgi:membrane-associated phospholipid phosphatase